ncbi:MAG: IS110 family transposase [Acidimicrobiia bacterium]
MHVGLDLGRSSLVVAVLSDSGELVDEFSVRPDGPGLGRLMGRVGNGEPVHGVIESMNGARFVYDFLTDCGWSVAIADAWAVKGIGKVAAKTDRIDARLLAFLSCRDLVPAIWIPSQGVRADRERARFRLHLVKHRTALKNRIHSILFAHGSPCPMSDLFGVTGRQHLEGFDLPEPWKSNIEACLEVIDHIDGQIKTCERQLGQVAAGHRYVPLLKTIPGVGDILGYTIAAEIGDIARFPTPKHLVGYTGLTPRVHQSGDSDWRGPLTRNGPRYLRWALIEAAVHGCHHPAFSARHERTRNRLGKQRGAKVARVETARRIANAIYWMLTREEEFNPRGPTRTLAA